MPGRNLFEKENPLPPTPAPNGAARNLLGDDAGQQRRNRLKALARAGLDAGANPLGETAGAVGQRLQDAFSLGLRGPVTGLANAVSGSAKNLMGKGDDSSFGERYSAGEQAYDEYMADKTEKAGWTGTGAGLVGGLVSGGGATRAAMSLPRIAAEAAGFAGVDTTARARGDIGERLTEGATGAVAGGATGLALGGLTSTLPGFRARRAAARETARGPDPETIKNDARTLYRQLDNAGLTYSAADYTALPRNVIGDLQRAGFNPAMSQHAGITPLVDELNEIMARAHANGGAVPFERLQQLRTMATDVTASNEPGARRLAGMVRDNIDDFVQNVQPSQGFMAGPQANDLWQQARGMWNRASKTEDLLWNVSKAERRAASANSGGNEQNALRQNVRGMLDKAERPGRYDPYNDAEKELMETVIRGTQPQNLLRSFGNTFGGSGFAPLVSTSATAGIPIATGAVSPAVAGGIGAGLYGAGRGARALSTRMAQNNVDDLVRLMATGSTAPVAGPATAPQAISVADALAQRLAARSAPAATREMYGGGW